MNLPYTITVQYNPTKCGWTAICNDDADQLVGVRYFGQMQKAITFANSQCHKIMDVGFDVALTVFGRDGERSYSVSPESFRRAWDLDNERQVGKDFVMCVEVCH